VNVFQDKWKDIDAIIDAAILKETMTGATFKAITSFVDEGGMAVFTVVFERISS
jgi:hypothetical protein